MRPSTAVVHRERSGHPRQRVPNTALLAAVTVTVWPPGHLTVPAVVVDDEVVAGELVDPELGVAVLRDRFDRSGVAGLVK